MTQEKAKIAVLISGNGSNLQALIDACAAPHFPAEIILVISNKADAYGLQRAYYAHIPTRIISHRDFPERTSFDNALHEALTQSGAELVCLAGFMRLLTPAFTAAWEGRMINIHPSLLPLHKGLNTHQRVLEAGDAYTGATVHYVVADMDAGEIIVQEQVAVDSNDTAHSLQQKVHAIEHDIYPRALRIVAEQYLALSKKQHNHK
jgi:phosphoribosylglycinamide formyltransferase-1